MEAMNAIKGNPLFKDFSESEISSFLELSRSKVMIFQKGDNIFNIGDKPSYVYILLDGVVSINKYNFSGNNALLTTLNAGGEMFGEVYAFIEAVSYAFFTTAKRRDTSVLAIPKEAFHDSQNVKLRSNMLTILAGKAYFLTEKLTTLSMGSIRQKLAQMIIQGADKNGVYTPPFNREALAEYLNVARPSLSRELNSMESDGIIKIQKAEIKIVDFTALEEILLK